MSLSPEDTAILDIAGRWYRDERRREQAVVDELALTRTQYARRLSLLLDSPAAALYSPATVNRLRRVRDQRIRQRTARRAS